uniref:Intracisternal A-particle Gag-related polyprotein n=1 Tax=Hamster intracisternal a-particle H18 TaxID=11752 RepID=GAG_IPHA|nr:RecName: Full=Intracisternal A-particle Gag-related polyprotein; Contains: RecName: Full=Matrix protein; Contains: RecName: Full=Phosphorylated protein; Contains: RecName: Full=Capsid protein; Contains: RecName: Full=Nucleocapsid protein; Contains: RecName: Full=Protease [Golden hamster intracisternal A-particle H18]
MGSSQSVVTALQTVLKQRDLKIAPRTLQNFMKEVDRVAPWYACSGSLTVASWNKLGKELDRKHAEGDLCLGTKAIWKLVKNCLEDEACHPAIIESQGTLEEVQDSMSETERSERMGARKRKDMSKKKGPPQEVKKGGEKEGSYHSPLNKSKKKKKPESSQYPAVELEALELDNSDSDTLDSSEEGGLEEEVARYEEKRYHPDRHRPLKTKMNVRPPPINPAGSRPSAPPPYELRLNTGTDSFLPLEERRKIQMAFPVFENAEGGRVHTPVDYNQIKELAESVRNYGVNANFTTLQVERLANFAMTPTDWQTTVKAVLPNMGQYMEWKALWYDAAQAQARVNATAGRSSGHLTKIVQGPQEPFSDFVARMTEAASRIFGDSEQAMPLIEQLVYEQATQECRAAIAPRKSKGLQDWLRVCRELGGPLTNAGLAAAILQTHRYRDLSNRKACFNCGRMGHLKKDCQAPERTRESKLCYRCGKGYHRASECGIMDSGADKSIISLHWWPKSWPTVVSSHSLQGLGYQSSPAISASALTWRDAEGKQGCFTPYVLPLPVNLWGRDVLQAMGMTLTNE